MPTVAEEKAAKNAARIERDALELANRAGTVVDASALVAAVVAAAQPVPAHTGPKYPFGIPSVKQSDRLTVYRTDRSGRKTNPSMTVAIVRIPFAAGEAAITANVYARLDDVEAGMQLSFSVSIPRGIVFGDSVTAEAWKERLSNEALEAFDAWQAKQDNHEQACWDALTATEKAGKVKAGRRVAAVRPKPVAAANLVSAGNVIASVVAPAT